MPRQLLRQILIYLTRKNLRKHGVNVVVIVGNGQTSIAREAIYAVLKTKHAVRRNVEIPETELSIPLNILGAKIYPQNIYEWIQTIFKIAVQLLIVKPHKHILVLEISDVKKDLAEFWLKIIQPAAVVVCGKTSLNLEGLKASETHSVAARPWRASLEERAGGSQPQHTTKERDKSLKPYFKTAKEVGKQFGISEEAEEGLKNFEMPLPRIRVLRGKGGQIVIDSSYHYSPPPLKSALELANQFEGKKILITDYSKDKETRDEKYELLDLKAAPDLLPPTSDIILIRGRKTRTRKLLEDLTGRLQP